MTKYFLVQGEKKLLSFFFSKLKQRKTKVSAISEEIGWNKKTSLAKKSRCRKKNRFDQKQFVSPRKWSEMGRWQIGRIMHLIKKHDNIGTSMKWPIQDFDPIGCIQGTPTLILNREGSRIADLTSSLLVWTRLFRYWKKISTCKDAAYSESVRTWGQTSRWSF